MAQYTYTTTGTVEALKVTAISDLTLLGAFDVTLEDGSVSTHEVALVGISGVRIGDEHVIYANGDKKIFPKEDFDKQFTAIA